MVIEKLFMTHDKASTPTGEIDVTFHMIEDEDGGTYWGYGHIPADEFTDEVNRWFIHTGAVTVPEDLVQVGTPVDHLWAKFNDEYMERFTLVDPTGSEGDAGFFPVTRLFL